MREGRALLEVVSRMLYGSGVGHLVDGWSFERAQAVEITIPCCQESSA
jgi:hypothetical protein